MCSWHLSFPFCRTNLQKQKLKLKQNETDFQKNRVRATIPRICARTVVSCWKSAHARGAVREPRKSIIVYRDPLGRALFAYLLFGILFVRTKSRFSMKIVPKIHPKWTLLGAVFRKWKKIEKCVSTAQARTDCIWAHTVERPGRPKITQKNRLIPGTLFF
jgi:hypothetical protein